MKQTIISILLTFLPVIANADAVEIDGIWYNLVLKVKTAEVTKKPSGSYSGVIKIPDNVLYNGSEYSVKSIGEGAFQSCSTLTSITIPNSVTSIEKWAFSYCANLTSITIPNSVTNIGMHAFRGCLNLTSVTIPNSLTSIDISAFNLCSSLTTVNISDIAAWCKIIFGDAASNPLYYARHLFLNGTEINELAIPNSVTSIGDGTFSNCSSLNSVTIPNSVTSIGDGAFSNCSSLNSVTIPNSVTSIGKGAFSNCSSLNSVTIPNSVKSIGASAFSGCSGLTTITIGNGVKAICENAFAQCPELTDVYCMAEELSSTNNYENDLLYTYSSTFDESYIESSTLHVPESAINAYKTTEPWSGFGMYATLSGEEMEIPKCATPTISIENGKVKFYCETEGAEFVSNVSTTDTKDYYDAELTLAYKYKVTVYATKAGYENSDTAIAEFTASGIFGDLTGDGVVNVADHVELSKIIMNSK